MKSVMSHSFSQVPKAEIQRSAFDRSHGYKTTFDSGYLIPVFVDEALPGDTFNLRMTMFARLATPIVPFMDNLFCDTFFFAVPNRLVWDNWEKFNGQQTDPDDSTDFLIPTIAAPVGGYEIGTLSDYFGIPTDVQAFSHSALWHRAYNLIWNEWFRDQNLQDSVVVNRDDGPDLDTDYTLLRRGKRHDYFTSCLPWPQKGPAVSLPLGTSAPVYGEVLSYSGGSWSNTNLWQARRAAGTGAADVYNTTIATDGGGALSASNSTGYNPSQNMSLAPPSAYSGNPLASPPYADLSEATAATINALRQAFQLQRLYERDARGGTRYTEIIRAHFGVVSPDARLQRPEYLGGSSNPIYVNPVPQTSGTPTSGTPQGNLAAFGTLSSSSSGFTKSFTEHCVIIGLVSVRADLTYQQGLNRMWSRQTRWDFYWPALAHIGEQAVLQQEICLTGTGDDTVFGYQERYAEYRYKPSLITGHFRSASPLSLDIWHLSEDFDPLTPPVLNDEFIQDNPPVDRVIATPTEPHFLFDAYFNLKCVRPMPVFSVPGLVDHF